MEQFNVHRLIQLILNLTCLFFTRASSRDWLQPNNLKWVSVYLFAVWLLLKPSAWSDAAGLVNPSQAAGQSGSAHRGGPIWTEAIVRAARAVPQRRGGFSCFRKRKQRRGGGRGRRSRTASGPQAHWANIKCRSRTRLGIMHQTYVYLNFMGFFLSFFCFCAWSQQYICGMKCKSIMHQSDRMRIKLSKDLFLLFFTFWHFESESLLSSPVWEGFFFFFFHCPRVFF